MSSKVTLTVTQSDGTVRLPKTDVKIIKDAQDVTLSVAASNVTARIEDC